MRPNQKPYVAIVGRPNVGKSTLFNRLAGRRLAIVEDVPGVTRDRHYADVEREGRLITLIDTGGFVPGETDALLKSVRDQAQLAIEECDVVLFVVDGKFGVTSADEVVAELLRKSGKATIVVVNKTDDLKARDTVIADFHRLRLTHLVGVSAEHGTGIQALDEELLALLPPQSEEELAEEEARHAREDAEHEGEVVHDPNAPIRVAIVGRPNVGKSTLVNALIGEERLVSSEIPGTTRDPIDTTIEHGGKRFILTDTAGIRRKKSIAQRVESFAVVASLKTIDRSDVAVVLLDATEPAVDQDARLAGIAEEKGRALIVVVNKWDLVKKKGGEEERKLRDELKYAFKFVAYAPVIFTSALTGSKVEKVLELAAELHHQWLFRAPTPQLNRLLEHVTDSHPTPIIGGKQLRLYYVAQVGVAPPAFAITTNRPGQVPDSYRRYVVNQIRATFDLRVPIRIFWRERPGKGAGGRNPHRAANKAPDRPRRKRPR